MSNFTYTSVFGTNADLAESRINFFEKDPPGPRTDLFNQILDQKNVLLREREALANCVRAVRNRELMIIALTSLSQTVPLNILGSVVQIE